MERRALLIGSTYATSSILPGVDADIQNLVEYLHSDFGGAWEASEISYLAAPSAEELNQLLRIYHRDQPDFLFIAFSGHGAEIGSGNPVICLQDGQYFAVKNLGAGVRRQVTVIDACRAPIPRRLAEERTIVGVDVGAVEPLSYRQSCRDVFDARVQAVAAGSAWLLSCSSGQKSIDFENGGAFTLSLINQARNLASQHSDGRRCRSFEAIEGAFNRAFNATTRCVRYQHPEFKVQGQGGQLPFFVA